MRHSIQTFCFQFLMVYSAKHREYQLVAKSAVPCFFNSSYFHNVDTFNCGMPRCSPGIGGTTQIWGRGTLKKSPRFAPEFVPPTSKPCRRLCRDLDTLHVDAR